MFFLSVLLVTGQLPDTAYAQAVSSTGNLKSAAIQIRDDLSIGNLRKDIARLSSLDSRVTGYPQAASGSKYIFDRFVEIGLQNVESRDFSVTVPIDHGDSVIEVFSAEANLLHTFKLTPLWPNLVRTSLLADGIKHTALAGETLKDIAESYQVDETTILADDRNKFLATPVVEGSTVFIPTGGLSGPLLYGDDSELADFNGTNIGGFWYRLQDGDTLTTITRRYRITEASITDDILNEHLQKASDGIDNDDSAVEPTAAYPYLSEPGSPTVTQAMVDEAATDRFRRYRVPDSPVILYDVGPEDLGKAYADGLDNDMDGAIDEGIDEGTDEMIDESRADGIDNDNDWNVLQNDTGLDGIAFSGDPGDSDGVPTSGTGTSFPGEKNIDVTDVSEGDQIGIRMCGCSLRSRSRSAV